MSRLPPISMLLAIVYAIGGISAAYRLRTADWFSWQQGGYVAMMIFCSYALGQTIRRGQTPRGESRN